MLHLSQLKVSALVSPHLEALKRDSVVGVELVPGSVFSPG